MAHQIAITPWLLKQRELFNPNFLALLFQENLAQNLMLALKLLNDIFSMNTFAKIDPFNL
jgi:hypothetical protein